MINEIFIYVIKMKPFLNRFLITVDARDYGTIMKPDVWSTGARLRDLGMPHGGLRFNGADKSSDCFI